MVGQILGYKADTRMNDQINGQSLTAMDIAQV